MPPKPNPQFLDIYDGVDTTAIAKESSVYTFFDFVYAMDTDKKREAITDVFHRIASFKHSRKLSRPRVEQEERLVSLYECLLDIAENKSHKPHPTWTSTEVVFVSLCTIVKNNRCLIKSEYPDSLKYIVNRYRSYINLTDETIRIHRCGQPKTSLIIYLNNRLRERTEKIESVRRKKISVASNKIGSAYKKHHDRMLFSYPERIYRPLIAQILCQISCYFEVVPTALDLLVCENQRSEKDNNFIKKAKEISYDRKGACGFRKGLPGLLSGSASYSQSDIDRHELNCLKSCIKYRVGSCFEIAQILIVALLNNPGLNESVKNNVCAFRAKRPDDHIVVGIKNFEGGTLILDAWIRHINLGANPKYRPNDVKSYDRERNTGFMGDMESYIEFMNNHEDGYYFEKGVTHSLVEIKDRNINELIFDNIRDLGDLLSEEINKMKPNDLYT